MSKSLDFAPTRRALLSGALALGSIGLSKAVLAKDTATELADPLRPSGMTSADLVLIDKKARPTNAGLPDTRGLWLQNPHTNEEITVLFWISGQYDNLAYTQVCRLMRDWRENAVAHMDPKLLHLLWAIQRGSGFTRPLVINSAFRTRRTNNLLAAEGAAINSLHLHRQATDLRLDGIRPSNVAEYVHSMEIGGVGFYPTFTHVDTGRVRTWRRR
ncbi:hypothetical protein GCM10019059_36150 [Camelimonas fluminis]|uniref:Murein endopeptidase K n=1 Tax=Camelimonas fluminis TaxID=1576911 RepID=A0ABV7UHC6_9HYPH|nr:DUF882 domain-containing protein [Camelimonas fluminis]GHE73330.1 hypothetical protein GCM10019059_36150 [Camelimonas fluminis]